MMRLIVIFLLFLIVPFSMVKISSHEAESQPVLSQEAFSQKMSMPSTWILGLYQLMKDTHEIFVQNKIDYWIQGGTLLGAVRQKGLIPWDDDIDINIKMSDESAFTALIPAFIALDYHIDVVPLGYKIVSPQTYHFDDKVCAPCIDVFFTIENDGKILYDPSRNVDWMHRDDGPIYIRPEELYPLRSYQLGECVVLGPNNPIPFLNACFGNEWLNKAICWNHFFAVNEDKREIEFTGQNRVPAQPTRPLIDRVEKSKTVRIYANMIGDLFHYGHMEFLKNASKLGTEVIVGLVSDEVAAGYKRKPIMSLQERVRAVEGCKYVDKVIPDTPLVITEDFISLHGIDYVVHGDDFDMSKLETYFSDLLRLNKMRIVPYTLGISTSEIINRIQQEDL